jgi:hypothetical protein
MSGLNLDKIVFDSAITQPNIGAVLLDSDGDKLTSTLVSGKQALDVNVVNASIVVTATDLDIRDLSHTQDSVRIGDGTDLALVSAAGELQVRDNDANTSLDAIEADADVIASAFKLEDAAHVSGDRGAFVLAVANHTEGALHSADGDYAPFQVDSLGRLRVVADLDFTGSGVADDAADSENPLKVGGKAYASLSADPVDSGDRFNLAGDIYRRIYVNNSAHMSIKNTDQDVTSTASELASTPLAGRKSVTIQNLSSNAIYIGMNASVTTSNGIELPKNSSMTMEWGENVDIWAIAASGTNDVRILEAA